MGNNRLKKVNFVLACLVAIASFVVSYQQNALESKFAIQNTLAETSEWNEEVPFMATAEIIDEGQGDVRVAAAPPEMKSYEIKVVEYENNTSVLNEEKICFEYEGSEVKFSLETVKDIATIDWGDGNKEEVLSGEISHKYNAIGKYTIQIDDVYSLDISGEQGIYSFASKGNSELVELKCGNTGISELVLEDCKELRYLDCNNININELDLADSSDLEYLYYGEGIYSMRLNSECKTKLKLSGSSETIIAYVEQVEVDNTLPEFKLNESDMTIDLGENYAKYEFAVTSDSNWDREIDNWYQPVWYSANNFNAVRNNKIYVADLKNSSWDNEKGITIRKTDSKNKEDVRIEVPKNVVEVQGTNGVKEKYEYVPLQNAELFVSVEKGKEANVQVENTVNINREDITVRPEEYCVRLRFKMPRTDITIKLNSDIEYNLTGRSNEVEYFINEFEVGDKFDIIRAKGLIEGYCLEAGIKMNVTYYSDSTKPSNQIFLNNEQDANIHIYDVEKTLEMINGRYERDLENNTVKLIIKNKGKQYYAIADINDDYVDGKVFNNFLCYVFNNSRDIAIAAEKQLLPRFEMKEDGSIYLGENWDKYEFTYDAKYPWYTPTTTENNGTCAVLKDETLYVYDYMLENADNVYIRHKDELELGERIVVIPEGAKNKVKGEIIINHSNLHISLANTAALEATVIPANENIKITWKSSDESIAKVDENGKITPYGVGNVVITARGSNGKEATCDLEVYALKYDSMMLGVGEVECIVHGADKLNSFESSSPWVASVDETGTVVAVSAGETLITAKDNNGKVIECLITVIDENTVLEPVVLEIVGGKSMFSANDIIELSVKSGWVQGSEVIIWEFELDGNEIATNSGYKMEVSKLIEIASKTGDIYNKEITLKAFPRDIRNNSDRETTILKFIIFEEENLTSWENSKVVIGNNTYKLAENIHISMNNVEIENMNKVFEILGIEDTKSFSKIIKVRNMDILSENQEISALDLFVSGNYDEINTKESIVESTRETEKQSRILLSNGERINVKECKVIKDNNFIDISDILPGDVVTVLYSDGYPQYVYVSSYTVEGTFERFGKLNRDIVIDEEKYYPSIDETLITSGDFRQCTLLREATDYIGENVKLHLNACGEYALIVVEKVKEDWKFAIVTDIREMEEANGIFYIPAGILLSDGTVSRDYKFIIDKDNTDQSGFEWENEVKKLENKFIAFLANEKGEILFDSDVLNLNDYQNRFGDNYIADFINPGVEVDMSNKIINDLPVKVFDDNTVIFNGGYDNETKIYSPEILSQWDLLIKDNRLNQRTFVVYESDTKYIAYVYVESVDDISSAIEYAIVNEYYEEGDKKYIEVLDVDGTVTIEVTDYAIDQENCFIEYSLIDSKLNSASMLIDIEKFEELSDDKEVTTEIRDGERTILLPAGLSENLVKANYQAVEVKDLNRLSLKYEDDELETSLGSIRVSDDAVIYNVSTDYINKISFEELKNAIESKGYVYVIPYATENASGYGTDLVEANILVVMEYKGNKLPESGTPSEEEETPIKIREFKDVRVGDWYYDIVTTTDYLEGTTDVTFSPDDPLTREMFIAALYNVAGEPYTNGINVFPDIPEGSWSEDAIIWACENDLVSGFPDGRFKPSENITRQEAIVVLKKYAEYEGRSTENRADLTSFTDYNDIYDWAIESISWAVAEGVISGDNHNELSAREDLTRAETVAIFNNLIKALK